MSGFEPIFGLAHTLVGRVKTVRWHRTEQRAIEHLSDRTLRDIGLARDFHGNFRSLPDGRR